MRIALVQPPPTGGVAGRYLVHEPLNLIALGTALREWDKAEVRIWDFAIEDFSDKELQNRIALFKPQIVGFTAMTSQIKGAAKIAEKVKSLSNQILTIVGGQHPTALPARTLLEFEGFDIAVVGEGEKAFSKLAKKIDPADIGGIAYRKGEDIVQTGEPQIVENLDDLPIADRDIVDRNLYGKGPVVLGVDRSFSNPITMNLSRGCPFRCHFCSANLVYGNKVRYRSIENIREELNLCKTGYKVDHVSINDSLFSFNKDFALSVASLMSELKLTWDCRARADQMTRDFAHELARNGCVKVFMGAEAASQRILDLVGKDLTVDQIIEGFAAAKEAKIVCGTQFVIGVHPSQTKNEIEADLNLAKKLDPEYCSFSIAIPLPGTQMYETYKQGGYLLDEDWDSFNFYGSLPTWRTEFFSPEQLAKLQRSCMLRFYLRPGYLIHRTIREIKAGRLGYQLKNALTLARFAIEKRNPR